MVKLKAAITITALKERVRQLTEENWSLSVSRESAYQQMRTMLLDWDLREKELKNKCDRLEIVDQELEEALEALRNCVDYINSIR